MTSQISPNSIDPTFPIAGVNNDTQGFRQNFANILNNFQYAAAEITALQNSSVIIGTTNNLAGTVLGNVTLDNANYLHQDLGNINGAVTVNIANGNSQKITLTGPMTLSLSGWPAAGNLGFVRIRFIIPNIVYNIVLPAVTNGSNVTGFNSLTNSISFTQTGTYDFEFSSVDNGATVEIVDITRGNKSFSSYSYLGNVSSGFNVSVTGTTIMNPEDTVSSGHFNLWNLNDGQVVVLSSTQNITSVSVVGNSGVSVYGAISTLPANTPVKYIYAVVSNSWFRI